MRPARSSDADVHAAKGGARASKQATRPAEQSRNEGTLYVGETDRERGREREGGGEREREREN